MDFLNEFFRNPLDYHFVIMAAAFVVGTFVGSFLNVCIARMPLEKSILWPGSRCGSCLRPIRWYDNIPLWGYWRLQGRCRDCGAAFSPRYFWIEFLTGALFAGLYWLECVENIHGVGMVGTVLVMRVPQWQLLLVWFSHAIFLSFLFVAAYIDYEYMEIPLRLTIPGTILGIIIGTLMPWPWPMDVAQAYPRGWDFIRFGGAGLQYLEQIHILPAGAQRWPIWMPPPEWLLPGTWLMGLVTSVAGAAAGTLGIRFIRFTFSYAFGKEAMGLGDADLMMLIGAFLGWQSLVVVMVVAVFIAVVFVLVQFLRNRRSEIYFGPFLAAGAVLTLLAPLPLTLVLNPQTFFGGKKAVEWVDPFFVIQPMFFDLVIVGVVAIMAIVFVFISTLIIRMMRLIAQAT
jgi:leader peptidase (prepilin peptidase) / N-methyltransferase